MSEELKRCWNSSNPLYRNYHDEEWGVPTHDDKKFFEFLVLGGFQAGLTWELVLNKRQALRKAFNGFDPEKVASYSEKDRVRIINAPDVIRNKAKITAAINNACRFLEIQREFGSFDAFVWQFVRGKTIHNCYERLADLPSETIESRTLSKELKKKGFSFVGPIICYAFMQATGLVNDHITNCFRHNQIRATN